MAFQKFPQKIRRKKPERVVLGEGVLVAPKMKTGGWIDNFRALVKDNSPQHLHTLTAEFIQFKHLGKYTGKKIRLIAEILEG